MPIHRDIWWLVGSAAAAIALAPLIVRGDANVSAQRESAARKIEQLSPAERQHLEENFRRFEKLGPAEQDKLRAMHAKIKENPSVGAALDIFSDWWPTVSARQQAELFRPRETKERMSTVWTIQEEIDDERVRHAYARHWGRGSWNRSLPRETFYEIMQSLEALASEAYVIKDELPEIQKLDVKNPQRYLNLITALHRHRQTWNSLASTPAAENRLVEGITNEKAREGVRNALSDRSPFGGPKGFAIRAQLVSSLLKELYLDRLKQGTRDADLLGKFSTLTPEERESIYSYGADESRRQLQMMVWKDFWTAFSPVPEFFMIPGVGGRGPGFDGGRPGFDGGRGRGSDGRDGGNGPRDGGGRGDAPRRD